MTRGAKIGLTIVALVALLAGGAWVVRGYMGGGFESGEVSLEAAASAEDKLERLRDESETVRLSPEEISSLMRYRMIGFEADFMEDPYVHIAGDTLRFTGLVPTERLPSHPELDRIRGFLPPTSPVEVRGHLWMYAPGEAVVEIDQVEFARIPIPERYYPAVLERMGRRNQPGLPPAAIVFRLPPGANAAQVSGGELLLFP